MQVMKFGGTSVANATNMSKVVGIVSKAVERDRTILVSSAISGCTDTLIKIGIRASERDESYKTLIDELQKKHHDIIRELLPLEKHEESRRPFRLTQRYRSGSMPARRAFPSQP